MTESDILRSTRTSRVIRATPERIYRAFVEPAALEDWMAPGEMTATVHAFNGEAGGGYVMSLRYSDAEPGSPGKSSEREDRYSSRFVELTPPSRIVEVITFDTADQAFSGEMTMTVTLDAEQNGTNVTIRFDNIPPGIRLEDNDAGTRSSLEKLARYVEAE